MRWPWVSREQYQAALSLSTLWQEIGEERQARYDDLLAKYHELRVVKGAETPIHSQPMAPAEPSAIEEAINARAGRNPALRRYLTNYANGQVRQSGDPEQIAADIMRWRDPDEVAD